MTWVRAGAEFPRRTSPSLAVRRAASLTSQAGRKPLAHSRGRRLLPEEGWAPTPPGRNWARGTGHGTHLHIRAAAAPALAAGARESPSHFPPSLRSQLCCSLLLWSHSAAALMSLHCVSLCLPGLRAPMLLRRTLWGHPDRHRFLPNLTADGLTHHVLTVTHRQGGWGRGQRGPSLPALPARVGLPAAPPFRTGCSPTSTPRLHATCSCARA